jgi:outer membrane protein assembly factor BamB
MKTNRCARLVVAGALAVALAGCTGAEDTPEDPASPSAPASGSEPPAEEHPGVDVPPADDLALAFTVPVTSRGPARPIDLLGPVFTEDLVLFTDEQDFLHAIDRATGQERWRVKRRFALKGGDTPCALTLPTPDAEVVVLNHGSGDLCGDFTVYSLADGSITEEYDSVPRAGRRINFNLASNSDLVVVEGRTYFLDADSNLLRLEADGTTSSVGSPAVLVDADQDWDAGNLMVLPGTDVMVTRLKLIGGEFELDEDDDGKLIGFRVGDTDLPEIVWEQDIPRLLSQKSSPGHVRGELHISDEVPGMVQDVQRTNGRELVRFRVLDPETGELGSPGYTLGRNNPSELPAFAMSSTAGQTLRAADSTVYSAVTVRGTATPSTVRRLDLDSGETTWSWTIPGAAKRHSLTKVQVISSSSDGALVYVRTSVGVDSRLWELDAATGEPVRSWKFSRQLPEALDLTYATVAIDDGDVFQLSNLASDPDVLAALYR